MTNIRNCPSYMKTKFLDTLSNNIMESPKVWELFLNQKTILVEYDSIEKVVRDAHQDAATMSSPSMIAITSVKIAESADISLLK